MTARGLTPAERFRLKYVVRPDSGCWEWTAAKCRGYGRFKPEANGKTVSAHGYAYQLLVGPVPDGCVLDHVCHNADPECVGGPECRHRGCVNPAHLDPVTQEENTRRAAQARARCRAGHPWDTNARARVAEPGRVCLTCAHISQVHRNYRLRGIVARPATLQRLGLTADDLFARAAADAGRMADHYGPIVTLAAEYAGVPQAAEAAIERVRAKPDHMRDAELDRVVLGLITVGAA